MTRILRIFSAFFLGTLVTFTMAESALRTAAWYRASDQLVASKLSQEDLGNPNVIRIVALGESTTTSRYNPISGDTSWPGILERMLNSSPRIKAHAKSVKIINIARSGTITNLLVEEFESLLPRIKPHFVISMMGVNDGATLLPQHSWYYRHSQFVRLLHWAWIDFRCPACYRIDHTYVDDEIIGNWSAFDRHLAPLNLNILPKTPEEFSQLVTRFEAFIAEKPQLRDEALIFWGTWLFSYTENPSTQTKKLEDVHHRALLLAIQSFEKTRSLVVRRKGSIKQACFVYGRLQQNEHCLNLIFEGLQNGVALTPDFLGLALSAGGGHDPRFQRILSASGYKYLNHNQAIWGTRDAYQRLKKLAIENSFHWFVMQYPIGSIGGLQALLAPSLIADEKGRHRSFPDLFFLEPRQETEEEKSYRTLISNKNFRYIASGERLPEYFEDLFARGSGLPFGHTTDLGHELIAKNAFEIIEPKIVEGFNR